MFAPPLPRGAARRSRVAIVLSALLALIVAACGGGGGGAPADPNPPALQFVSLQADHIVVQSGEVSIAWVAEDADDAATVSIFADRDGDLGTTIDRYTLVDEITEADGARQEALTELTGIPGGTYTVIGRIRDGKGTEKLVAASGRLIVEDRSLVAPFGSGEIEIVAHLPRADGSFDVLGRFRGNVSFDARYHLSSTARQWNLFVANYTPRGVVAWMSAFECSGDMEASAFVRDGTGDLLIAGAFGGNLTLPDRSTIYGDAVDAFLARVSPEGRQRWVRTASSPNVDIAADIALLADGSFVVTGTFCIGITTYGIDFGTDRDGLSVSLPPANVADAFVARYAADGTPIWARSIGGASTDRGLAATVLPGDRIAVGGAFEGTASFGDITVQRTASGAADGFLTEWSSSGKLVRVDTFVGVGDERVVDIARCADGDLVVLANSTSESLDVAGQVVLTLAADNDATLTRIGPNRTVRWALAAAVGAGPCSGAAIAPLADDSVLVTGTYADGARFGPAGPVLDAVGDTDAFLSNFDADGSLQWLHRFSSSDAESGLAISARDDGTILFTGDRGDSDLSVTTQHATVTLAATDGSAEFIARFNPDGGLGRSPDPSTRVAGSGTILRGSIALTINGLAATLRGFDEVETTAAVRELIEDYPLVALLVVEYSNGQNRGSAHLDAARAIAAAGIETHIPFNGSAFGGGIDLFLGGRRRTAEDGATVGVRSWLAAGGLAGYQIKDDPEDPAHVEYLDFHAALGVPHDYYWFSIQTPWDGFLALTRAELEQYSVVTD